MANSTNTGNDESPGAAVAPTSQTAADPGEFVSEPIQPDVGTFDARAMAQGRPGLPRGFTWRGRHHTIVELLDDWKCSESWNHGAGERYYRKHYYRVRVDGGAVMTLYALRQIKRGANPRRRWWLYRVEAPATRTIDRQAHR